MSRGHRPLRHPAMSMRYRPKLVHFTAVRQNTPLPRCRSRDLRSQLTMYITDVRHFLDEKGAVGPQRGPARVMAEFHAGAIAFATDFDDTGVVAPACFKRKKGVVNPIIAPDDAIYWACPRCNAEDESRIGGARCGT